MKKITTKHYLIVSTVLVILFAIVSTTSAAMNYGEKSDEKMREGQHQKMMEMFENDDYAGWKGLVSKMPFGEKIMDFITEENFDKFSEAHQLMSEGDMDGMHEIMEDLDMSQMREHHGQQGMMGGGHGFGSKERNEPMKIAVENGDYKTWEKLVSEMPYGEKKLELINEENFYRLKEAHKLIKEDKYKEAKEIFKELGLEKMRGHGKKYYDSM